jgi:hypothetical protein
MSFLVMVAALWPPPPGDGPTIHLPRSWVLGQEGSACPLRQADVLAVLGQPDLIAASGWLERWSYDGLGIWFEWERPAVFVGVGDRIGPEGMAALRLVSPSCARPLLWFVGARYAPKESLVEVGWYGWGLKWAWRCE